MPRTDSRSKGTTSASAPSLAGPASAAECDSGRVAARVKSWGTAMPVRRSSASLAASSSSAAGSPSSRATCARRWRVKTAMDRSPVRRKVPSDASICSRASRGRPSSASSTPSKRLSTAEWPADGIRSRKTRARRSTTRASSSCPEKTRAHVSYTRHSRRRKGQPPSSMTRALVVARRSAARGRWPSARSAMASAKRP